MKLDIYAAALPPRLFLRRAGLGAESREPGVKLIPGLGGRMETSKSTHLSTLGLQDLGCNFESRQDPKAGIFLQRKFLY